MDQDGHQRHQTKETGGRGEILFLGGLWTAGREGSASNTNCEAAPRDRPAGGPRTIQAHNEEAASGSRPTGCPGSLEGMPCQEEAETSLGARPPRPERGSG